MVLIGQKTKQGIDFRLYVRSGVSNLPLIRGFILKAFPSRFSHPNHSVSGCSCMIRIM
jgi:hypothetical protein